MDSHADGARTLAGLTWLRNERQKLNRNAATSAVAMLAVQLHGGVPPGLLVLPERCRSSNGWRVAYQRVGRRFVDGLRLRPSATGPPSDDLNLADLHLLAIVDAQRAAAAQAAGIASLSL